MTARKRSQANPFWVGLAGLVTFIAVVVLLACL